MEEKINQQQAIVTHILVILGRYSCVFTIYTVRRIAYPLYKEISFFNESRNK